MCRKLICLLPFILVLGVTGSARANLVGHWPLDDGSGTTARDSSGNGNNGTLMGDPKWVAGQLGGALSFDGTQDYVDCGSNSSLHPTDAITMAAWFMIDSGVSHNCFIMSFGGGWNDPGYHIFYHSGYNAFRPGLQRAGEKTEFDNTAPSKDEWHHIALTWDTHGDKVMRLYIDGEPQPVTGTFNGPIGTPGYNYWIGGYANTSRDPTNYQSFLGKIDDVRVYSRALRDVEILGVMAGGGAEYPLASGPNPADGALYEDTWATLSWRAGDFAVSHDVYFGENFDDVNDATDESNTFRGNQATTFYMVGFPGFAYPDGLVPGTTYYWRIDEVNDADPNSPWKGNVWSFSIPPKIAYNPDPADGAESVNLEPTLSWTPGLKAKMHTVYFGDDYDTVANATVGTPIGTTSYNPGPLEAEKVYYWRVDEFDGIDTFKGNVWAFTTPGAVGSPQPANGAIDVAMATVLRWTAADNAASHEVYLGLEKNVVRSADTTSPEYKGAKALGAESYDAGLLEANTTYYWRIDEVYAGNTVQGPVWTFTVGAYLLVDDFESYTDNDAAAETIWQTWVDGFNASDNGAQVGNLMPPYCEQTIVHGGTQSMPLFYTNEGGVTNSEASLTLTTPRDWRTAGVGELSLWFRGSSANAADPLYVAISNAAGTPTVAANEDPAAATIGIWTEWRIPLQAFADQGINLTNVDKFAIGLGSKAGMTSAGGSGIIYIDDIRLYR